MSKAACGILMIAMFILRSSAYGDEAVTLQGRRFTGTLQLKAFALDTTKQLPLSELHHVLLPDMPAPLPDCRLMHQLLLPGKQRLTGEMIAVRVKDVKFQGSSGEIFTVSRRDLRGIVSADGFLSRVVTFTADPVPFRWIGAPVFSDRKVFSGKNSLWIDADSSEVGVQLPATMHSPHPQRISWFFYDSGTTQRSSAQANLSFEPSKNGQLVTVYLGDAYYSLPSGQYRLPAGTGWHMAQVDIKNEAARVFIDDFYLGSVKLASKARCTSLRFSPPAKGSLWVDAIQFAVQWPIERRQPGPANVDEIWLNTGEQLFGHLLTGDDKQVSFNAPYGKRSFSWSDLRGTFFFFDSNPPIQKHAVDVFFRCGPGFTNDQLTGTVVDLNDRRLLLKHLILGELTIERSRLRKVGFH
jgi:hypothetical protein